MSNRFDSLASGKDKITEKEQTLSLKHEIKQETLFVLKFLSTDGLPNIFRSKYSLIKLAWAVLYAGAVTGYFYFTIRSITQFFECETSTEFRLVTESIATFPTVQICNINAFNTDYARNYLQQIYPDLGRDDGDNSTDAEYLDPLKVELALAELFSRNFSDEKKYRLGLSMSDMLVSCQFAQEPCTADDFEWIFNPRFGNCFVFNSGRNSSGDAVPIKTVTGGGFLEAFDLEIFVGVADSFSDIIASDQRGALVSIDNKTSFAYELLNGLELATSSRTAIGVERSFFDQYPYPFSECTFEQDKVDYEIVANKDSKSQSQAEITNQIHSDKPIDTFLINKLIETGYAYSREHCVFFCLQVHIY